MPGITSLAEVQRRTLAVSKRTGIVKNSGNTLIEVLTNLIPILSLVLTAIIGVATILGGLHSDPGDDDTPPVVLPGDPVANQQLRTDLLLAINYRRGQELLPDIALDLDRHERAQQWAVRNAKAGKEEHSSEQVTMIQAHLLEGQASADNFLNLWMHSEDHAAVLLKDNYANIGIGIAVLDGTTWAVVQFTSS